MKVLIVEDNLVASRIIESTLQKRGFETMTAKSGKYAIEMLIDIGDDLDLIITDLVMPEIDGLNFITIIKNKPLWKKIPIIVSTSLTDSETVKKVLSLGVKYYVIKPIDKNQLLNKVNEAITEIEDIADEEEFREESGINIPQEAVKENKKEELIGVQEVLDLLSAAVPLGSSKVIQVLHKLVIKGETLTKDDIQNELNNVQTELKEKLSKMYDKM